MILNRRFLTVFILSLFLLWGLASFAATEPVDGTPIIKQFKPASDSVMESLLKKIADLKLQLVAILNLLQNQKTSSCVVSVKTNDANTYTSTSGNYPWNQINTKGRSSIVRSGYASDVITAKNFGFKIPDNTVAERIDLTIAAGQNGAETDRTYFKEVYLIDNKGKKLSDNLAKDLYINPGEHYYSINIPNPRTIKTSVLNNKDTELQITLENRGGFYKIGRAHV